MSLGELLRAVAIREDVDSAKAFAAILNADRTTVRLLEGRQHYTSDDVLRLGRIVSEYKPADGGEIAKTLGIGLAEGMKAEG